MKTNLEKWNYYKSIIDAREEVFLKNEIIECPSILYDVYPNGTICEKVVTGLSYNSGNTFWFSKKPTKLDVERIKNFAEENVVFNIDCVGYKYEETHSYGKSRSSMLIKDSKKYLTKEEAEKKSIEVKQKISQEQELLKNGHSRCERCRKVVPTSQIITSKIISYATYGAAGRTMKFCSDECATHEQYAHEG